MVHIIYIVGFFKLGLYFFVGLAESTAVDNGSDVDSIAKVLTLSRILCVLILWRLKFSYLIMHLPFSHILV